MYERLVQEADILPGRICEKFSPANKQEIIRTVIIYEANVG